jgi:hypothetical protein
MKAPFEEWMKKVDAAVEAKAFVSIHDLPDMAFYALWEDGLSPTAVARLALEEAGW